MDKVSMIGIDLAKNSFQLHGARSAEAQSQPIQERRKPIRSIVQKDPLGSSIACVAMLAGKSYGVVAKEMFPDGVVPHTNTGDLKLALAACGLEPRPAIWFPSGRRSTRTSRTTRS